MRSSVYAGMLSTVLYQIDTSAVNKSGDFRAGFKTVWKPSAKLEYTGFMTLNVVDGNISNFYSLRIKYTPTKRLLIMAGLAPTLSTELRAEPATGDGQFEPWSLSRIPGTAPSIKVKYTFARANGNSSLAIGAGIASRNDAAEYHGYLGYGKATLVAYMRNKKIGTGFAYTGKRFYQFLSYDKDDVIAGVTMVTLKLDSAGRNDYAVYCDFGTVPKYSNLELQKSLPRLEIGLLKFYYSKYTSGLFGLSYCREINSVKGYLFLHL